MAVTPFMRRFGAHLLEISEQLAETITDRTYVEVPGYRAVPPEDLVQATRETLDTVARCLVENRMPTADDLSFDVEVVRRRSRQGVTAGDWIAHSRVFMEVIGEVGLPFGEEVGIADAAAGIVAMWGASNDHAAYAHELFEQAAAEVLREDEQQRQEYLAALLRGGLSSARARAGASAIGLDPDGMYCATRVRPGTAELARRLAHAEPTVGTRGVWVVEDGEVLGVSRAGPAADVAPAVAGVGPLGTLEALPRSFVVAAGVLETAERFSLTGAHRLDDLGALPLIAQDGPAADALLERFVTRVEAAGASGRTLVETVEAYLRHGLQPGATAAALHLHPNSLRKRLGRYEELTGADLRSMDDLACVWWALRRKELTDGG